MAYAIQLELFESNDELSLTKKELDLVKKELNNVRRGLFARFNSLSQEFSDKFNKQQDEIEELRKNFKGKAQTLDFPTQIRAKKH